jgi:hypothetical protein
LVCTTTKPMTGLFSVSIVTKTYDSSVEGKVWMTVKMEPEFSTRCPSLCRCPSYIWSVKSNWRIFNFQAANLNLAKSPPPPHAFRNRNFTFAMKWQFTTVAVCFKTSRQEHFSVFTTSNAVETFWFIIILKKKTFPGGGRGEE